MIIKQNNKSDNNCSCKPQDEKPTILIKKTNESSCCPPETQLKIAKPETFVIDSISTPAGKIKRISTTLSRADYWGNFKSRISSYRMDHIVEPGLYAVGNADAESDIFVSANYKLSFDKLRKELDGLNGWILVLDTKGINVWCAAGKTTFGTEELIFRINNCNLSKIVNHKRIILPQLCAVGVNSSTIRNETEFRVYYGPVLASDIKKYIQNKYQADKKMRTITFSMLDRIILTPMEIIPSFKKSPLLILFIFAIFGLNSEGIIFKDALSGGLPFFYALIIAITSGAFLTPLLLPFIPFRSFAVKGLILGALVNLILYKFTHLNNIYLASVFFLFFPFLSSDIALQFTGSTTFTCISGVKKELKYFLPLYIAVTAVSFILLIIYKLTQWNII